MRRRLFDGHWCYPSRYTPLVGEGCPAARPRGPRMGGQAEKTL
ncbi:hypothetical protein SL1157_1362 [Ruegeria lacuscaerulensis ITI-1157]|nr:hypothetical protein SL1157_1362 [Ruegeria lacuscaerulensis ITI-1157]